MKKTNATIVALVALTVSTSAFAVGGKGRETRDSKGRDQKTELGRQETSGASVAKAATTSLVGNISNGMKIESAPALASLGIKANDIRVLNSKTAAAYDQGLFGAQQTRLFNELQANTGKAEYQAVYANIQVLAAKNMLTDANLKWTENVDGRTVEINSMDFISGEALSIAKGSSPKFVQFMARKTQLEKDGSSTKDAITQALKELGISFQEFVRKCLVKA